MGGYRIADRIGYCAAAHYSACNSLWLAHALFCKCFYWHNMGIMLLFLVSEILRRKCVIYLQRNANILKRIAVLIPSSILIPLRIIFKNRTLWALMFMYFCCQWANYFFVAWMPVYLQEGRHFSEAETRPIIFALFITGIAGFLAGGFFGDRIVKTRGLIFGRRFVGMIGLGMCGCMILFAALSPQKNISAYCLIAANGFFSFGVMVSYAVCSDIGRNNAGTVTGAMNFFGQMGAFFLALMFGKIADMFHNFTYPLFVVALVMFTGCVLWLAIDPTKQVDIRNPVYESTE